MVVESQSFGKKTTESILNLPVPSSPRKPTVTVITASFLCLNCKPRPFPNRLAGSDILLQFSVFPDHSDMRIYPSEN